MNKYPTSWNEVNVEQYIELSTFAISDFETDTEYYLALFEYLTDATDEEINTLSFEDLLKFISDVRFIQETPIVRQKNIGEFHFIELKNLTLGNFIDLEVYFNENWIENLPKILSILYRRIKVGEWGENLIEPIGAINFETRIETMKGVSIGAVGGIIQEYLTFRNRFIEQRAALFEMDDPEEEETDIEESQGEKLQKKWSWESFLFNLAEKDITKIEEITEMNLFFVFNIVSMRKELKIQ